jgi:hypothetical protein
MAGWGKQLVVTFVRAQIIQRLLNMSFCGVLLSSSAKLDANDRPTGKADRKEKERKNHKLKGMQ